MTDNPYKAPESDVAVVASDGDAAFYVVSKKKFSILYFATLGIYYVYWFFRNWKLFKSQSGQTIWPVPRAIFAIFFAHGLFAEVDKELKTSDKKYSWQPGALATTFVVFAVASGILNRLSMREIGSPWTDVLSLLMLFFIYQPLAKAQQAINVSQGDPQGTSNDVMSGANIFWIAVGALVWLVSITGLMIAFGVIEE